MEQTPLEVVQALPASADYNIPGEVVNAISEVVVIPLAYIAITCSSIPEMSFCLFLTIAGLTLHLKLDFPYKKQS